MDLRYTEDIKPGDILLVHTKKGFVPRAIRYFTKCYYNHAAIVVEAMGELCVLEAVGRGFMITKTYEEYRSESPKKRNYIVMRTKKDVPFNLKDVNTRLKNIIGHPYDYKSLLYSQLINQVTSEWKGVRDIKAEKRIYCSEACAYAYHHLFPRWWRIAPVDIYNHEGLETVYKNHW